MSRIDGLIAEHCPDGVEFRALGDVVKTIATGKLNANAMVKNGTYPFFTCNANPFKIDTYAFDTEAIIISGNGSQVGHINYYKGKFNAYQRTYVVSDCDKNLSIHYLLFYLKAYLKNYILQHSKKGSVPYITMPMLQNFSLPIPPLKVQEEIVKILDTFTELGAELAVELKARQQQYNHCRDILLNFDDDVFNTLGDVCKIKTGPNMNKQFIASNPGKFPVINSGREPLGFIDQWNTENDPIGITSRGAGVGFITWCEGRYYRGNLNYSCTIMDKTVLCIKYLFFVLNNMQPEIQSLATYDGIPALNKSNLEKLKIPVPSLKEQERIVAILDKFDTLVNDISNGLPAEINLRRQQYQYYRHKLLTFKKT